MERIRVLIDKLAEQKRTNSTAAEMLLTVQLLHHELLQQQQKAATTGTSKVSVVMPVNTTLNTAAPTEKKPADEIKLPGVKKEEPAAPFTKPVFEELTETPKEESYTFRKPALEHHKPNEARREEVTETKRQPVQNPAHFDAMAETPTLLHQPQQKELHEVISEKRESLNDKLKVENTELAHKLKDSPIKDLRKAIGINDKFVFVSELFRGDEGMYERSVKTINAFHILPEAEYWMNRELKVKLGWNDNKEAVQHFYQLVRRRFS